MNIQLDSHEPQAAAATLGFFGIGNILHWIDTTGSLHEINTVLSTISFLISITIGIITLTRLYKKWKKK